MRFLEIDWLEDIAIDAVYNLAIFASGFERRATHAIAKLDTGRMERIAVLGFASDSKIHSRIENDTIFKAIDGVEFFDMDGIDDDQVIYRILDLSVMTQPLATIRMLVDYSVMTRAWYGAILTWARMLDKIQRVEIDFVYSSGRYMSEFGPLLINDLTSLPNFEGISGGFRNTTALFGLGYDTYATLAVYDRIEPDVLYCCVAGMQSKDPSVLKVIEENKFIIDASARLIQLPLLDTASTFRYLCDLILSIERDSQIVIVPMGPKPHVLVTLLVALRMPWVTCLHAKGERAIPVQVEALGPISVSRIIFVAD